MPYPATILIVEDEPGDAMLVERAFEKAQIPSARRLVRDGEEAIAYLSGKQPYSNRSDFPLPTVVLLDLKLPRKSGLEVLGWLRDQPGLNRLRVVVLTSSREELDVNRAHDLGISSYLVKPVEHGRLVEMMASLNSFLVVHSEWPSLETGR
jgi:CheY-like chemotaxis protein